MTIEPELHRFARSCTTALRRDRKACFLQSSKGSRKGPLQVARRSGDGGASLAHALSVIGADEVMTAFVETVSIDASQVDCVVSTELPDWSQIVLRMDGEQFVCPLLKTPELLTLEQVVVRGK